MTTAKTIRTALTAITTAIVACPLWLPIALFASGCDTGETSEPYASQAHECAGLAFPDDDAAAWDVVETEHVDGRLLATMETDSGYRFVRLTCDGDEPVQAEVKATWEAQWSLLFS